MKKNRNEPRSHIELFAGCGGLSLGLKVCGFELTLANELSPMASESFAFNLLDEDLEALSISAKMPTKTYWINSQYPDLKSRLRENPFLFPAYGAEGYSDIPEDSEKLKGSLLVGSIVELNRLLAGESNLAEKFQSAFNSQSGLDLVSGGPPCQSFSMAGLRQRDNDKNSLPWEFAKFIEHSKPKIAILENVTGILRPFKGDDGSLYYAWYEVAKAFASVGYVPICFHVNARFVGIPQNRPRFIMLALRKDHFVLAEKKKKKSKANKIIFLSSKKFFDLVQKHGTSLEYGQLDYYDLSRKDDRTLISQSFASAFIKGAETSVESAIDDLKQTLPSKKSEYVNSLSKTFSFLRPQDELNNHLFRRNSDMVKRRFRLYQVLQEIGSRSITNEVFEVLRGKSESVSDDVWKKLSKFNFLKENGTLNTFENKSEFAGYLKAHPTKKQTQKALIAAVPAPAALSIPDDACHYDPAELRVLTVREMARIQSFPDNFVFRSKITTGGQMRRFEVPQYTQVGNAVPPLLGIAIGKAVNNLLDVD